MEACLLLLECAGNRRIQLLALLKSCMSLLRQSENQMADDCVPTLALNEGVDNWQHRLFY
jgi:hypothetical protein